ncbi:ATP synthase F1 subunit delta [Sporocytophaga myxococcoides]|uniref:ATP synthase F1 subunit delta n=1 Tax=Sporocytophaga myxococcoides TaxID=153721 RepID=UPI000413699A|nr:ATP synthase F1 subunit delta [Sporocytophaga myxococcoides]
MHESRIAAPYAKSLLELAQEKGVLEEVQKDMAGFAKICNENRQLVTVLRNPVIKHGKKLAILTDLFKGKVNPITFSIFQILTKKNREAFLYDIAVEFGNQYRKFKGIEKAVLTTAAPITEEQRAAFVKMVETAKTKKVELEEHIDESIMGGFVLNIGGDKQVDQSIKTKLVQLKSKFKDNPFISKY